MQLMGSWPVFMGFSIIFSASMCETLSNSSVQVWDHVISRESLQRLLTAGNIRKHSLRTVIDREQHRAGRTAIESVVISALEELEDSTRYIEYWWRDTWMNLPAHRDIDEEAQENAYKRGEVDARSYIRTPRHGYVLYATIDAGLLAPTCLWEERSASHLQTAESRAESHERIDLEKPQGSSAQSAVIGCPHTLQQMHVVPAVPGRLLRFRGDLLHAAPKSANVYLDANEGPGFFADLLQLVWPSRRVTLAFNTWETPPSVERGQPVPSQSELGAVAPLAGMPRCDGFARWHALFAQRAQGAPLSQGPTHATSSPAAANGEGGVDPDPSSAGEAAAVGDDPTHGAKQELEARIVVELLGNAHRRGGCGAKAVSAVGDARALHAALRSSKAWHTVSLREQTRAEARRRRAAGMAVAKGQSDSQPSDNVGPTRSWEGSGASESTLLSLPFWLLALLWPLLVLPPVIRFSKSPIQTSVTVLLLGMVLAKRYGLYDMDGE